MKIQTGVALLIMVLVLSNCRAPKLMQTVYDWGRLTADTSIYKDKPLKNLLKEIKPPIKMVWADGRRQAHGRPSYFVFIFHDREEQAAWRRVGSLSPRLFVYVKDTFDWKRETMPLPTREQWTKKDLKKYGDLKVVYVRASGRLL